MRKMFIAPEAIGYGHSWGDGAIAAILDGGAGQYRADHEGAASRLTLSWVLDEAEYRYMRAFYRTGTKFGTEPFLIDLVMASGVPSEHVAKFVPGTMTLSSVSGEAFRVRASIEARPGATG